LACGDQRRLTGNGSALEVVHTSRRCAIQIHALLLYTRYLNQIWYQERDNRTGGTCQIHIIKIQDGSGRHIKFRKILISPEMTTKGHGTKPNQ